MTVVIGLANFGIGGLIGISGIAGFLLPILLSGFLGMALPDALALSFASFLTSGALGAWSYKREGNLDLPLALPLCAGSLAGALAGVRLNLLIPVDMAKILLYAVVLLSGISVLLKRQDSGGAAKLKPPALVLLGFVTAAICSLTGAGGPVLVAPLLASLGVGLRTAVGVSLLDSVAIALPACVGYFTQAGDIWALAVISVICHGAGVLIGAKLAGRVNLKALRLLVAFLSISAACYMLLKMFFHL